MSARSHLIRAAQVARQAVETGALRQEVEAQAAAAAKPVQTICGIPLPVEFGRRDDDSVWVSFGVPLRQHMQMDWPGTLRDASAFATALNALPLVRDALKAARSECRDPDTDATLSAATGDSIETALRALGERL